MKFIDLQASYNEHKSEFDNAILKVLSHGQYVMGPEITQLEQQLSQFVGVKHSILTSSGTTALGITLMALGVGPGDEVITSPFSFFASVEVILLLGAKPVFVDIDPLTYNIDANQVAAAITDKTKVIMPVSLYGQMADMQAINTIASRHDLAVVEDAAQSFGATHHGKPSCALSTVGCSSFFPSKPLGAFGDGGACFTDDDDLAETLRQIINHGQDRRYHHVRMGVNGRLDSMQAAVLMQKLKLFPQAVEQRQQVAAWYRQYLSADLRQPTVLSHNLSVFAQYTIECPRRDQLQERLQAEGVPTAVHYPCGLHQQPAVRALGLPQQAYPHTEHAAKHVLSLPFYPTMPESDVQRVAQILVDCQQKEAVL